jgi:trimeric autotransporter adhesin
VRECRNSGPRSLSSAICIANKLTVTAMFKSVFRVSLLKLLPLSLLFFGCGTQRNGSQLPIPAGKHGLVHGGQQPVSGATIQLYAVGTTGDGSASTPLLSPAPLTDANGAFNISGTYHCPSSSSLVYIVASGGNPGLASGTNNSALVLMAALGPCGNLSASTYIFINELTTLAAVYPLAPYMTSPSVIGSSSTDAAALANAFTLASEFVNTSIGAAPGTGVPTGTIVPVAQINTIGDILAPCIDSAGGTAGDNTACGNLFALTTLTGFAPPTNTITVLLNLANNPALNTASLYSLIPADAPFQPTQPQTPPDLSVRLTVPSGFTVSPTVLNFPPTRIGVASTSAPQTVTFTNNTATPIGIDVADILNSSPTASGADPYDFRPATSLQDDCPTPVLPGATCSLHLTFSPLAVGARSAYLTVFNTSANPYIYILLTGEGLEAGAGPAAISPPALAFNASASPMNATLTNFGTLALTIDSISISSDPTSGQPAFTQTNNCGTSLAPQGTCTIVVSALSTTQPYSTGTLAVGDDAAAGPQTLGLSYSNGFTGPELIDFGSRSVGTQGSGAFSFQPPGVPGGTYSLSVTGPDAADFSFQSASSSQSGSCTASRLSPFCSGTVYFTPSALGIRTATLNLSGSPAGGLIGIGLSAGLHFSTSSPSSTSLNNAPVSSINFFPAIIIGQTSPATTVGIVNTGTVPITLNAPVLSGANPSDFSAVSNCSTLAPNGTCSVTVTASPAQPNNRSATLTLTDSTGTATQTVSLTAVGVNPPPVANPSTIAFAYTPLGTISAPQSFTITSYNNDPVTVTVVDAPLVPFFLTQGNSCTRTPCQISVAFAPTAANTAAADGNNSYDNIVVTDLYSGLAGGVSLSGINIPPLVLSLSLSPGSLTFPLTSVGATSTAQNITLTNTGNQALVNVQASLSGTDPGDFLLTNNCSTSVAVGANCSLVVTFFPTATGTRTALVEIMSNASSSPNSVQLTGTGQ